MTRARDLGDFIADGAAPELVVDTTTLVVDSTNNRVGVGTASPSQALDVNGTGNFTAVSIGGTAITATATELNIMDGVTATASELNIMDGVTATTAELNILDGVTATATELNLLDGVTATTTELNYNDITTLGTSQASKTVTADANGDVNLSEELKAKSYNETYVSLSAAATVDIDNETGNVFALTTNQNTTFTFSNPPTSGTSYGFTLKLTAGGTHTITYPNSVDFAGGSAPDAPASGETDVLVFFTVDGGTNWYGAIAIDAAG